MASLTITVILVNAILILAQDESEMRKFEIVPDVIDTVPPAVLKVTYRGGLKVNHGNVLTPTRTRNQPTVTWDAVDSDFYTLVMVNPDAPSRSDPKYREWHHWLVVNIPGNKMGQGDVLSEYAPLRPPPATGLHRYVLLVFKQQGKETFSEARLNNRSGAHRSHFSTRNFAKLHNLGEAIAGNFFQAEWDGSAERD